MNSFLVIQTAFIGDVILATPVIGKLRRDFPEARIDVLIRKGNESLLQHHPGINNLLIWDKKDRKWSSWLENIKQIRSNKYDVVINLQRFGSTGLLTAFSGGKLKIGFDKNPFSFMFDKKIKHVFGDELNAVHETDRNLSLIKDLGSEENYPMELFPGEKDKASALPYLQGIYYCIAPTSVWFTKQFPASKWIELIDKLEHKVYLLGAPSDFKACEEIRNATKNIQVENLCGKLSLAASAVLMKSAKMNYVNDSAPLHLASAMNAPVTAIFCSTIPAFGFGPRSENSRIIETKETLSCRPCGLHGYKKCPEGHFKCALTIDVRDLL